MAAVAITTNSVVHPFPFSSCVFCPSLPPLSMSLHRNAVYEHAFSLNFALSSYLGACILELQSTVHFLPHIPMLMLLYGDIPIIFPYPSLYFLRQQICHCHHWDTALAMTCLVAQLQVMACFSHPWKLTSTMTLMTSLPFLAHHLWPWQLLHLMAHHQWPQLILILPPTSLPSSWQVFVAQPALWILQHRFEMLLTL